MTGNFLSCLSDHCCFYERLSPGRSKTYVTFDITKSLVRDLWLLATYVIIVTFSVTCRE